jgi:FAD:protein FMN transferase
MDTVRLTGPRDHLEWPLWSTTARLVVTDPGLLDEARVLVDGYLAQVDDAANRFRADSEISALRPGADGYARLSPVLADLVSEALAVAWFTAGDVDPTVGTSMNALGYDRDLALVLDDSRPMRAVLRPALGWRKLRLVGDRLLLPRGVELDLGATAKAAAADRAADLVHRELGVGVLVSLGGTSPPPVPARCAAGRCTSRTAWRTRAPRWRCPPGRRSPPPARSRASGAARTGSSIT